MLLAEPKTRKFFADSGRSLLVNLLTIGFKDTTGFVEAYDDMIGWLSEADNWPIVDEELSSRGVRA